MFNFIRRSSTVGPVDMERTNQSMGYSNQTGLSLNLKVIGADAEIALYRGGNLLAPLSVTSSFHRLLQNEICEGNPFLSIEDQSKLRHHYPLLLAPDRYPPKLVERIYVNRRAPAVQVILEEETPMVFDAGCGYGSESFLFASMGARVLAVDISTEQIQIAKKRQRYFEEILGRPLDVTFVVADLDEYNPTMSNVSITWLASVLAAVKDQEGFLRRVFEKTREGGKVIITDMNLLNPLFLWNEWRRRKEAIRRNVEFRQRADFLAMFKRRDRKGARYFFSRDGESFDDVQFFGADTLSNLLRNVGFYPQSPSFSGFVPPALFQMGLGCLENIFGGLPLLRELGYFYVVVGIK